MFAQNVARISEHNILNDLGLYSYRQSINSFADQTPREVYATRKGFGAGDKRVFNPGQESLDHIDVKDLPTYIDWRITGIVTDVKNQGSCGSCWAFATVASLEGLHALATRNIVTLSAQNLVDCAQAEGNHGCGGGYPWDAFQYIIDNKGIDIEDAYPYKGHDETCAYRKKKIGAGVNTYLNLTSGDETVLKKAVAILGPIAVGVDASGDGFASYSGGVYDDPDCENGFDDLDHAMTIVGYGTDSESGKDYWLVKYSWGTSWGMNGYIRMARNANNQCGIPTAACYPNSVV